MAAHQPTPMISLPVTVNKDLAAKADLLYASLPPNIGLIIFNTQPALKKRLEAIYNLNGKLGISSQPAFIASCAPLIIMLYLVTWDIDNYVPLEQFAANRELWSRMLRAQSEILSLPRFGWTGWALSWVFGDWVTKKFNLSLKESVEPVVYEEFNAFHHGGKVSKQDRAALEDVLSEGEKQARKVEALREVVKRATAKHC